MQVDTRSLAERDADTYLSAPPYMGFSDFAHLNLVKQLCGEGGERVYDGARRAWGTTSLQHLVRLVGSGVWFPLGIDQSFYGALTAAANARLAAQEREWIESEARRLAALKRAQEEAARKAANDRRAQAAKEARGARGGGREAPRAGRRRGGGDGAGPGREARAGVEPSAAEVAECARLGFTAEAIEFADTLNELGPRGTLSLEGRLLRWCSFFDREEADGPLVELTREERKRAWNSEQRFPLPETNSRAYARELNARARQREGAA